MSKLYRINVLSSNPGTVWPLAYMRAETLEEAQVLASVLTEKHGVLLWDLEEEKDSEKK